MRVSQTVASIVIGLFLTLPVLGQKTGGIPIIWHDHGNVALLDLTAGSGGAAHAPGTHFTFIKESTAGTSAKFVVEDENGARWKAKLGDEVKSETAAARLLWAAGYFVDDDYYRPQIQVKGLKRLARGQKFVSGDTVTGVRLERELQDDKTKTWDWYENPFSETRELNGLKVMMALINGWDLKAVNNGSANGQYGVTDLGASFGRTGSRLTRSKGVMKDYAATKFIAKVTPTYVDFVMHSRPFILSIFDFESYRERARMTSVVKRIPIADARWIGGQLGKLSNDQIRDAFRASGFTADEVDGYTVVVLQRIAALKAL